MIYLHFRLSMGKSFKVDVATNCEGIILILVRNPGLIVIAFRIASKAVVVSPTEMRKLGLLLARSTDVQCP